MPVVGPGASAGTSGRALGCECRLIWNGSAVPASAPWRGPAGRSGRTGRRPARPCGRPGAGRPDSGCRAGTPAAVLDTVRYSDQRNASARSAGAGTGNGAPAIQRASGAIVGLGVDPPVVDCSTHAVNSRFISARSLISRPASPYSEAISTVNSLFTVRKKRSILPLPWGRPGVECTSLMPSFAQARSNHESTKALPLSTLCRRRHSVDYADAGIMPTPARTAGRPGSGTSELGIITGPPGRP